MKIKKYAQFTSERVKTEGTYLQKSSSRYSDGESPIHKKRFGNVFARAKTTSGADWGIEIEPLGNSVFDVKYKDEFFKHLYDAAKTESENEKSKWINEIKNDLKKVNHISTEGEVLFNRTHFPGGIPDSLRGLSLGYIIYEALIKHLGFASSQSNASDKAQSVWSKIAEDPDFLGVICDSKILVIYKEFKGDLWKPFGDIILDFIDSKIDNLMTDELEYDLSTKKNLSTEELIQYFLTRVSDFSIDAEIIETYPQIKQYLSNYLDSSRNLEQVKILTEKIKEVKAGLKSEFEKSPKAALDWYNDNKSKCESWQEEIKILNRRTKVDTLDKLYYDMIVRNIQILSVDLKFLISCSNRNISEESFNYIKKNYYKVKDGEESLLNNLPKFGDELETKLQKLLASETPKQIYGESKFNYLRNKVIGDLEKSNPEDIKTRISEIESELDDIKDIAVKIAYKTTKLIDKYYPNWHKEAFSKSDFENLTPKIYLKNQLQLAKINSDIKTFDEVYTRLFTEFERWGYKKAEELYHRELKPQIENIQHELTLDLSWCQNTLVKYFKNLIKNPDGGVTNSIKNKPLQTFDILLEVMQKIEIDKKKALEKKAYKKFTKELEEVFKSSGYESAQQLYDKEIEKVSNLLDIQFFDSPDYGTTETTKTPIALTGKEHLEKRLQLYKQLGVFPKIVVKPVEEPKVDPDTTNIERPKEIESPQQKTFIQRFKDFLGI